MADDGPLPPAPFVEYDPELLLEDMGHLQVPIVINAVSLAALQRGVARVHGENVIEMPCRDLRTYKHNNFT